MKRMLLLGLVFVGSSLVSIVSIGAGALPAMAEDVFPAAPEKFGSVVNALASPTSAERFFEEGRQQLEQEIQRLQQGSNAQTADVLNADVLNIDPAIFQQQHNLQQEQDFLDGVRTP